MADQRAIGDVHLVDASTTTQMAAVSAAGRVSVDGSGVDITVVQATAANLNARVVGFAAHDAAGAAVNPVGIGGYASAAAPSDVSADNDIVRAWLLRNGSQVTTLSAAGALIGGDATNGLDVDVTRVTGTVTVDTELPAASALANDMANPTTPLVGAALMVFDGSTWDRAPGDSVGGLRVDLITPNGDSAMDDTNDAVRVNIVTGSSSGVQYTEDAVSAGGESLTLAGAVRQDTIASSTNADGDYATLKVNATGSLYVDTELPAAAALSDTTGNPTTSMVGAASMIWDGTQWVRRKQAVNAIDSTGTGHPTAAIMAQLDDVSTGTVTENQFSTVRMSSRRALLVEGVASGTALITADNQTIADNAGFTDGASKVLLGGYVFDEVAGTALTENDAAAARIDAKRAQVGVIEDATTRGQRAAVSSGGRLSVDGGLVTEDAAAAADPVGYPMMARRRDSRSSTEVDASGDIIAVNVDKYGAQYVHLISSTAGSDVGMIGEHLGEIAANQAGTGGYASILLAGTVPGASIYYNSSLAASLNTIERISTHGAAMVAVYINTTVTGTVTISLAQISGGSGMVTAPEVYKYTSTGLALVSAAIASPTSGDVYYVPTHGATEIQLKVTSVLSGTMTSTWNFSNPPGLMKTTGEMAHDAVDAGYPVKIGGYAATNAPTAVAAADRVNAWFSLRGALKVDLVTPNGDSAMDDTNDAVKVVSATNLGTNLAQVAGTTTDTNSGNKSAGTQRVVLATDQPALTNALLTTPGGNVAHDAADSGSPVKVGAKAKNALPTAVSNDDRADAISDLWGRQLTSHIDPAMQVHKSFNATSTQTGTDVWSPASGKKIAVTSVVIGTYGTTAARVILWFGDNADTTYTAGTDQTLLAASFAPSSTSKPGLVFTPAVPVFCTTADRELHITTDAGISIDVTVEGYEF